jgi:beta-xylosidase
MTKRVYAVAALLLASAASLHADNPIIKDLFTADPAALVVGDTVYLYTGHDEAPQPGARFIMKDWRCFSSTDMLHWKPEGVPLSLEAFPWAKSDAWASQVIQRNNKFYWYAPVHDRKTDAFALAVAVSDSPTGPFKDALGKPLITSDQTPAPVNARTGKEMNWDDIDPTVFIDDKQAYLIWGNTKCHLVKLKENMTETDGEIQTLDLPRFTEAPWIHKYNNKYYLSYAYDFPEKIAYATADKITGPYTFGNVINDTIPNSPTNHQSIIQFKNRWYFIYHTAALPNGGEFHRSVAIEELHYNPDGSIQPIHQTKEGITEPAR